MSITIYSKGGTPLYTTSAFSYQGSYMGERSVSVTVASPTPISFLPEDFVEFRNERFVLDYTPTAVKTASPLAAGDAFTYELKLVSLQHELEKCSFKDVVLNDNGLHYSGTTDVQFTGDVQQLADRLLANLNQLYPSKWTVAVAAGVKTEAINISCVDQNCWEALLKVQSDFKLNFTVKGRTVTIGTVGQEHPHVFEYGRGKGLYSITRTSVDSEAVVTRLRAYGSTENLPKDYKKGAGSALPAAQYIPSLMLPGYESTLTDYLDASAEKLAVYGVREGVLRDDTIKPTIKEMTGEQLRSAGVSTTATGRIDEVVAAEAVTSDKQETFKLTVKDLGFNIKDHLSVENATLEFTDGKLGGIACEILDVVRTTEGYTLLLGRNQDNKFTLPDQLTNAAPKDHFVLTNLRMPDVFVKAAEQRLLAKAQSYLSEYDHAKSTYAVGMDELFMVESSLKDVIYEGDLLKVRDADLAIDSSIIVQQLNIKFGGDLSVPTYDVTLSDKPTATTLNRVQDSVTRIEDSVTVVRDSSEKAARRNVAGLVKLKNYTFDPETGKLRPENLKANSIDTLYLSTGSKASNFVLLATVHPNYRGDASSLALSSGVLQHREIAHGQADVDGNYRWLLPAVVATLSEPAKAYYIYAKCATTSSVAEWFVTAEMLRYNNEESSGWYFFRVGVVYEVQDGVRADALDYGRAFMNGRFLSTGIIMGAAGLNGSYFDLDRGIIRVGGGSTGLSNFDDWKTVKTDLIKNVTARVELSGPSIITYDDSITPIPNVSTVTLFAAEINVAGSMSNRKWEFSRNNEWLPIDGYFDTSLTVAHDSSMFENDVLRIRYSVNNEFFAIHQVAKIYDGKSAYRVELMADQGTVLKNGMGSTTLFARVFRGPLDVTDTVDEYRFEWSRASNDPYGDQQWALNKKGMRSVTVGDADVSVKATFFCTVNLT